MEEHLADEDDGEEREHRDGEDGLGVHDVLKKEENITFVLIHLNTPPNSVYLSAPNTYLSAGGAFLTSAKACNRL